MMRMIYYNNNSDNQCCILQQYRRKNNRPSSFSSLWLFCFTLFLLFISGGGTSDCDDANTNGVCLSSTSTSTTTSSSTTNNDNTTIVNACKLYMAPSSIPKGGYGLFTSRTLQKGQLILGQEQEEVGGRRSDQHTTTLDGPNIPVIIDSTKRSSLYYYEEENTTKKDQHPWKLFDDVWWGKYGGMSDRMWREVEDHTRHHNYRVMDYQITFGALPNYHPYQSNLAFTQPTTASMNNGGGGGGVYDDYTYLNNHNNNNTKNNTTNKNNTKNNPLQGSFSYYNGKQFTVNRKVEAGTELFLDYGPHFFDQHDDADGTTYGTIPRRKDYFSAATILQKIMLQLNQQVVDNDNESGNSNTTTLEQAITDKIRSMKTFQELLVVSNLHNKEQAEEEDDNEDDDFYDDSSGVSSQYSREEEQAIHSIDRNMIRIVSLLPTDTNTVFAIIKKSIRNKKQSDDNKSSRNSTTRKNSTRRAIIIPSITNIADAIYTEFSLLPPKTTKELNKEGMCLDHIIPGHSQIPLVVPPPPTTTIPTTTHNIGRGAIAQRFIAKGAIIVPVPLLHLLDRSLLQRRTTDATSQAQFVEKEELLINYCFGHSQSTMLFCPITNALLLNHCSNSSSSSTKRNTEDQQDRPLFPCSPDSSTSSTTTGGSDVDKSHKDTSNHNNRKGPNAMYRWATNNYTDGSSSWEDPQTTNTLTMTIEEIASSSISHRMVSMEIIALRDINAGDEILIDYGEEWEKAWLEHVHNWNNDDSSNSNNKDNASDEGDESILTEYELNDRREITPLYFGTVRDNTPTTIQGRYQAVCWYQDYLPLEFDLEYWYADELYWKELQDEEIYKEYTVDARKFEDSFMLEKGQQGHGGGGEYGNFWPCSILSQHKNLQKKNSNTDNDQNDTTKTSSSSYYSVRIFPSGYHRDENDHDTNNNNRNYATNLLLVNYPRESIRFFTLPYQGDQHLPNAFRHHIEIRDEIFPDQWKNLLHSEYTVQ